METVKEVEREEEMGRERRREAEKQALSGRHFGDSV